MEETSKTILTLIQILVAFGAFEAIKIGIKYFVNRKRNKIHNAKKDYLDFNETAQEYIQQTAEMAKTITELRNQSLEQEERIIEMNKKLDEKNQLIISLSETISELNDKIVGLAEKLDEVLERAKILDSIKCERDGCENRIPPQNKTKTKRPIIKA